MFVAAIPTEDVFGVVESSVARPPIAGVRWTTREQWHVTLRFLGTVGDDELDALVDALDRLRGHGAVEVTLGPATACFSRSLLIVPASGLVSLAAATVTATAGFGSEPPEDRPHSGHVTLARSARPGRLPRRSSPDLRPFAGIPLAASWTASSVALVRSYTERTGARYEVLAHLPL